MALHNKSRLNCKEVQERLIWIDTVKVIAILLVILVHCTETVYKFNLEGIGKEMFLIQIPAFTFFTLGRLGVPLFLMTTGYLLLDREWNYSTTLKFYKKNFLGLLFTAEAWIIIFNLYLPYYNGSDLSIIELLNNMLFRTNFSSGQTNLPLGHWWYMPCILGIYLFIPLVGSALRKNDLKMLIIPGGALLLKMIPGGIGGILNLDFMGGYYGLIVIMGFICKKGVLKRLKKSVLFVCLFMCLFLTIGFQIVLYRFGYRYNVWYNFLPLVVTAICLFEMISRCEISQKYEKIITLLSKDSFGIYLIHYPLCKLFVNFLVFDSGFIKIAILYLISLVLSLFIVEIIKKIPKINKVLLYTV